MSNIVQVKSLVLAVVAGRTGYVEARRQIEELSQKYGLAVADMPMLIQAVMNYPEVREAIRLYLIDTITSEYHGQRDGDRSYEAWHSAGSLSTAQGLEKLFPKAGKYWLMPIPDDEWVAVGKGSYNEQTIARVHLEDARKGAVPAPGTSYTIFVRLDKDMYTINPSGQLSYDTFMRDDRALMITGGPESREVLACILFGKKEEGKEEWTTVGSYHRMSEVSFDTQAKGYLARLDSNNYGLCGGSYFGNYGRFVGVDSAGACRYGEHASTLRHR